MNNNKREIFSLTNYERNELARKFKYYYKSIRPSELFNLIETINGTYFCLNSELEILQTIPDQIDIVNNFKKIIFFK